ncbi:MAG: hypothetical protein AB8B87_04445 [Granulosicoccus sp.]
MNANVKKAFTSFFCAWFALTSSLGTIAHAQSSESDFEAPIIEHEEIKSGNLGDVEVFAATVVDNEDLKSVSLFYRYSGENEFTEIVMQPLVQSAYYSAKVDTTPRVGEDDTAIEYYIRAEDASGNVVLKGLSFDPLVRTLRNPEPATPATDASIAQTPSIEEPSPRKKINWLYVGVGILLVGGIAAAAGGGGDDGGGNGENPDPDCNPCTVTLTLATP